MRPATMDDAELAADIMAATYPSLAHDPVVMRLRWKNMREGFSAGRFIGELSGRPIAFLAWIHGPWEKLPERHCEVEVWLDPAAMDRALLTSMWSWIAERAVADGARLLLAYAAEDETEALDVLAGLGYERDRIERVWELDLQKHGPRLVKEAAEARSTMSGAGIRLMTLAEWNDPAKHRKLYELNEKTVQDVPHSLPIIPETFADFERRLRAPDRPHDRFWVACHEDGPVAMSYLKYPPVRGTVWTGYTSTHPQFRGRGIAKAVKLQTLAQAVALGVPLVYTDNDSENAPMLHINETLGYQRRPGFVAHLKRVDRGHDA
jgi:RimJ/RimL family protein N-acetyltransferase